MNSLAQVSLLIPWNFPTVSHPVKQWKEINVDALSSPRIARREFMSMTSDVFVPTYTFLQIISLKRDISRTMMSVSFANTYTLSDASSWQSFRQ